MGRLREVNYSICPGWKLTDVPVRAEIDDVISNAGHGIRWRLPDDGMHFVVPRKPPNQIAPHQTCSAGHENGTLTRHALTFSKARGQSKPRHIRLETET